MPFNKDKGYLMTEDYDDDIYWNYQRWITPRKYNFKFNNPLWFWECP